MQLLLWKLQFESYYSLFLFLDVLSVGIWFSELVIDDVIIIKVQICMYLHICNECM